MKINCRIIKRKSKLSKPGSESVSERRMENGNSLKRCGFKPRGRNFFIASLRWTEQVVEGSLFREMCLSKRYVGGVWTRSESFRSSISIMTTRNVLLISLKRPTGLSLIKNCNFEAGWLRADVQFKFNLSPDWYAVSSPCMKGPLLGRSSRDREKRKLEIIIFGGFPEVSVVKLSWF